MEKKLKKTPYKLQFNGRFMTSSLANPVDNLA